MLTNLTIQRQSPSGSRSLPSNTVANPRGDLKSITTHSGVSYDGPMIPTTSSPLPKEVEHEPEAIKNKVQPINLGSTAQSNLRLSKFLFQSLMMLSINIPKFASTFKSLLSNKEKLFELENTLLNENCSAVLLKKLPEKLGDLGKFLIPCDFLELVECLALSDLGASINLMPLSIWKKLSLPKLTHTRMTLELANRSVAYPVGVAEYVIVKVRKFHFPAGFVVVDYDVDPYVPLIFRRPFLKTARALVVHANESINMINFIDIICEDRFSEVLKFKKSNHPLSGSTTSHSDLSLPDYEVLCFEEKSSVSTNSHFNYSLLKYKSFCFDHMEEKSSDSTTTHSDYSLSEYDAFYFDDDHIKEKNSGSTTTHSDFSLPEYDSFIFDVLIDPFPPADRSVSHHEEFVDELAHIISPPEYDRFYFDIEPDPGELTILFEENISKDSTKEFTSPGLNDFLFSYPIVTPLILKNFLRSIF
ncbi:reverse transcriptase domain-containing protein [Tanacetum coccineum]|uniref:Reverse transcriptase domain-containing protein n=1 Tax=Tanacetum coccineum TaxID=301880 RepID=A0ABQ5IJ73_9ASTR